MIDYNSYPFRNKAVDKMLVDDDEKKKKKKKPITKKVLTKINGDETTTITHHPSGEVTKRVLTKKVKSVPTKG